MTSRRFATVGLTCLLVCASLARGGDAPAGTTLKYLTKITDGVTGGSKPKEDADFEFLKKQDVHYLLQVRFLPFFNGHEKSEAKKYGMKYLSVPMNASPISPSEST